MKLFIIILCLGLEMYAGVGRLLRFSWLNRYLRLLAQAPLLEKYFHGWPGLLLAVFPLVGLVLLVNQLLHPVLFGMLSGLWNLTVLLYCFGPGDFFTSVNAYLHASTEQQNRQQQSQHALELSDETYPLTDQTVSLRRMTAILLQQANQRFFGVIFWFVLVGAPGVVLYRLCQLLAKTTRNTETLATSISLVAAHLYDLLNWLPARLFALLLTLMGHFAQGFAIFKQTIIDWRHPSDTLLEKVGLAALDIDSETSATVEENQAAVALLKRTLVLSLVLLALFTLGAWVN